MSEAGNEAPVGPTALVDRTYWIVGASEGLGRALAHRLSRMGARLVVSARSAERLESLVAELPGRARAEVIDVRDRASVADAAQRVGPVDGLIYMAGVYWPMSAQTLDAEQLESMCDINFTGAARCVAEALPAMVARDAGHIVLVGSLSGFRGLPGATGYGASKAGVMYLAEGLRADLRGSGIRVQLANPGFIRTRLTDKNKFSMPFMMEPDEAAGQIVELMMSDTFARSFPAAFSWLFRGSRFLPDWLYYRLVG